MATSTADRSRISTTSARARDVKYFSFVGARRTDYLSFDDALGISDGAGISSVAVMAVVAFLPEEQIASVCRVSMSRDKRARALSTCCDVSSVSVDKYP